MNVGALGAVYGMFSYRIRSHFSPFFVWRVILYVIILNSILYTINKNSASLSSTS